MQSVRGAYCIPASRAARQLGVHIQTITNGIDAGTIDGRIEERGRRRLYLLRPETVEELAQTRCSYDGCDAIAPGKSGRCGRHRAKVQYANKRRSCKRCGTDLGPIPGSRIKQGRGKFCEVCWPEVRDARLAQLAPTANPDGARQHHRQIAAKIEAEGLLDRTSATVSPANRYRYSASHIAASGLGQVQVIDGSPRRIYDPAEIEAWEPPWAAEAARRASIGSGRSGDQSIYGRLAHLIAEAQRRRVLELAREGRDARAIADVLGLPIKRVERVLERILRREAAVGRGREVTLDEERRIRDLAREGKKQESIADKVGVGRGQVYRVLKRQKNSSRNPP
jgi:hypothetical protein